MDGFVKMAVRAGLILTITAAVLVLFSTLTIPGLDFSFFSQAISKGLAIGYHWCPGLRLVIPVLLVALGVIVAIKVFELASMAFRWILKVNEG